MWFTGVPKIITESKYSLHLFVVGNTTKWRPVSLLMSESDYEALGSGFDRVVVANIRKNRNDVCSRVFGVY